MAAIIGIAALLGLSGYFGYSQFTQSSHLQQENDGLKSEAAELEKERSDLLSYTQSVNKALDESQAREEEYDRRINELTQSMNYYKDQAASESYQRWALESELSSSLTPPYTLIQDRNIVWVFEDSRGTLYNWEMPFDTYRSIISDPEPEDVKYLRSDDGTTFEVPDFSKFVEQDSFSEVIDDLYENAGSDHQFLYEVWYVTSQLTTYSTDIGEDPRWALETFTEAGGDCEDLTILISSMLKSSAYTRDWKIEMVYFDSDSPEEPNGVNHVALYVTTSEFQTYVESTAKVDGLKIWESVNGWYFEL